MAYVSVSVLFNEPKLLKLLAIPSKIVLKRVSFSALQRAEIAEMEAGVCLRNSLPSFSALQRAEIAEIRLFAVTPFVKRDCFSALQRAEIAEIVVAAVRHKP